MTYDIWTLILKGIIETLEMTVVSTFLAYVVGLPYGIFLKVTAKGEVLSNKVVYNVLAFVANILRSVPFMILLVFLIPVTRFIVGTSIGTEASIVPLTIGTIPIVARMVEQSLNEVPDGIIEAAESMGAGAIQIIIHFLLPEAVPSLLSGVAINIATVLGYSAMAGCIGGGGLGALALNYGYYRYRTDILVVTILVLIIIVQLFQEGGNALAKKIKQ